MTKLTKTTAKLGIILFPIAVSSVYLPIAPVMAFNQFDVCVQDMMGSGVSAEKAGTACADALIPRELSECVSMIRSSTTIDPDNALAACYRVRRPVDLANCVVDIDREIIRSQATLTQKVTPSATPAVTSPQPEAQTAPSEPEKPIIEENPQSKGNQSVLIAQAVPSDESSAEATPIFVALDSCRRSLLPGRYSECVTGLSRSANLPPVAAMNTCLDAQAFPADIFPAYEQ